MTGESIASLFISLEVDDKASAGLKKIDVSLGETSAEFKEAKAHASGFGDTVEKTGAGSVSFSSKIGGAATSLATVGASADKAMNLMDRYQISQMTVENATMRVTAAQENYDAVLVKYPANSQQAIDATRQLEIAQNNMEKANIHADSSMVMIGVSALSMVPNFIDAGTSALTFAASGTVIASMGALVTTTMGAIRAGVAFMTASAETSITALSKFLFTNPIGIALLLITGAVIALKLAWDSNFGGIQEKLGSAVAFLKEKLGWLGDAIGWVGGMLGGLAGSAGTAVSALNPLTVATGAANNAQKETPVVLLASTTALGKLADAQYAAQQKVQDLTKAHSEGKATMDQVIAAQADMKTATDLMTEAEKTQKNATDASTTSIEAMRAATISAAQARYDAWKAETGPGSESMAGYVLVPGATDTYIKPSADARTNYGGISVRSGTSGEYTSIMPGEFLYAEADAFLKTKGFAKGGEFWTSGPTPIMVGEGGESEFVSITPKSKMGGGSSGGVTINFNAPIYGIDDLQRAIDSAMQQVYRNVRALGG